MKRISAFFLGVLVLSAAATAAVVEKIEIITGKGEQISPELVLSRMKLHKGCNFTQELLSDDIKSLYESGYFSDVNCEIAPAGTDSVVLKMKVVGQPKIRRVVFKGNEFFETKDLVAKTSLKHGDLLNLKTLAEDKKGLIKLYEDKSYFGTVVKVDTETMLDGQADVVWQIEEKARYKVGEISFAGNESIESDLLEDLLITKKNFFSRIFPVGFVNKEAFDEDKRLIANHYREKGFLNAEVADVTTKPDGKFLNITFHVKEGERFTVAKVQVEGTEKFKAEELLGQYYGALRKSKLSALETGKVFDGKAEKRLVEFIKTKYHREGYISVSCRPTHGKRTGLASEVDVVIKVTEGKVTKIRDISISGSRVTKDYVIRRELNILPGDLADKRKIDAAQRLLQNLNYFETVNVIPVATEREEEKDLNVSVVEKRTGQFMIGAGFSTEDDVIGSVEISQTNFDLSNYPYFTGGGQKMRLRLQTGSRSNEFLLALTEPWLFNKRLSLNASIYARTREYDEYDQQTIGTNWSITRKMDMKYWRQTSGIVVEQIEIDELSDDATPSLRAEEGTYDVVKFYQQWTRNSTDHFRFPTRGSKFTTRLDLLADPLGAYNTSVKYDISYNKFIPVSAESDWVLKLGGRIAGVTKIEGDEPAIFDRYFAGGPGTIRGFKYRDVGPVDILEDPIGGQSMLTATAELRIPIIPKVHLIFFSDAGNVWADDWKYAPDELNVSVGLGLRLNMGIPITLDYGWPVVTDQEHLDDAKGRLHFNIGFSY